MRVLNNIDSESHKKAGLDYQKRVSVKLQQKENAKIRREVGALLTWKK